MTKKTATLIQRNLYGWGGVANLYRVDPPMAVLDRDPNGYEVHTLTEHVVVSAIALSHDDMGETFIFPADENGRVTAWGELPGSQRGLLDHEAVLRNAGYEVVE